MKRDPAALALTLLALVSLAGPLWGLAGYDLASQFADDAFYYFEIARNVARGHGASFDGVHATTGFHPLWLALLVPIFALPGHDLPVQLAGTLEAALIGAAAVGLYGGLKPQLGTRGALLAGVLLFAAPGSRGALRTGLEGALVVALLVLTWRAWLRCAAGRSRAELATGAALALLVLARPEGAVVAAVLALAERRAPRARLLALLLPPLGALASLAALNAYRSGLPLPVSALTKRAWALERGAHDLGVLQLPHAALQPLAAGAAIVALVAFGVARWPAVRADVASTRIGWLVLASVSMLGLQLSSVGSIEPWYRAALFPGLAALAAVVLRSPRAQTLLLAAAALVALARVPYTVHAVRSTRLEAHLRGEAADALARLTPEGTRIGAWNGGMLGYYADDRHVIMLDGLANDVRFYRAVTLGADLRGYLRAERIDHLAVTGCKPARELSAEFQLSAVLAADPRTPPCDAFTLWRRRAARAP